MATLWWGGPGAVASPPIDLGRLSSVAGCVGENMLDHEELVAFVPVLDMDRARAFYVGVLGLRLVDANPYADVLDANGTTVRVTRVEAFTPHPFTSLGWSVADMDATVVALVAADVAFERFDGMDQDERGVWTTPGGDQVAWFKDPDGNLLSLTQLTNGADDG